MYLLLFNKFALLITSCADGVVHMQPINQSRLKFTVVTCALQSKFQSEFILLRSSLVCWRGSSTHIVFTPNILPGYLSVLHRQCV